MPSSAPRYATFGSNMSSGVFGPILPSFTKARDDRTDASIVRLRDLVKINSSAQLLANLLIFCPRPRLARLGGQRLPGMLALLHVFQGAHGAMKGAYYRCVLVYGIGHEGFAGPGIHSIR
jgi:hypothetical protein